MVDRMKLCRDVHSVLNLDRRRLERAWGELRCLDTEARAAVRASIGVPEAGTPLELPREEAAAALRQRIATGRCLLVVGESGVGKSALVVRELSAAQAADPDTNSVVFLNLRHLPPTMTKTRELLGEPLERVLGEMTTPNRLLVIDGADFAAETSSDLLAQLIRAAKVAGVTPWIVAATDASAAVGSLVEEVVPGYDEHSVAPLTDDDLSLVAGKFPALRRLLDDPRSKELLRRPAVVDLFVRAGTTDLPLSEADALRVVWTKLVRNDDRSHRGAPDARDQVFRRLAEQQLRTADPSHAYGELDPTAVAGLRRRRVAPIISTPVVRPSRVCSRDPPELRGCQGVAGLRRPGEQAPRTRCTAVGTTGRKTVGAGDARFLRHSGLPAAWPVRHGTGEASTNFRKLASETAGPTCRARRS